MPTGPLLLGIDETLERRRGKRIAAKGIYRDPVRSSHSHFVKASGLPLVRLRWVLIRDPQGHFATQALLCTDLAITPHQILAWFVQRWQLEVTFEEARRHLGLETQRQRSEATIRRTTPVLLGLFSLVTLLAHQQLRGPIGVVRQATWYAKRDPTFANALALVRRELGVGAHPRSWQPCQLLCALAGLPPPPTGRVFVGKLLEGDGGQFPRLPDLGHVAHAVDEVHGAGTGRSAIDGRGSVPEGLGLLGIAHPVARGRMCPR